MENNYLEKVVSDLKNEKDIKIDYAELRDSLYLNLKEIAENIIEEKTSKNLFLHRFVILFGLATFPVLYTLRDKPNFPHGLILAQTIGFYFSVITLYRKFWEKYQVRKKIRNIKYILKIAEKIKEEKLKLNNFILIKTPNFVYTKINKSLENKKEEQLENKVPLMLRELMALFFNHNEKKVLCKTLNFSDLTFQRINQHPENEYLDRSNQKNSRNDKVLKIPSLFNLSAKSLRAFTRKKAIEKCNRRCKY